MTVNTKNDNQNLNLVDRISNVSETPKDATQDDLLNSEYFADGLVDYIKHADTPLSISLNGEWGSGKTSIMNTVKSTLCDGENAKFYGIWINTWQFSLLDSSNAPQAVVRILQSIINQIVALKPDYERRKKVSQLIGALATISSGLKSFSDAADGPLFGVGKSTFSLVEKASNALNKLFNTNFNQSQTDNAALVKQLSNEIQKLVDEILNSPDTKKPQENHVAKYEPYNPFSISKIPDYPCANFVYFIYFCFCNLSTMSVFIVYYLGLMFFNVIFGFIGGAILSIVKTVPITKAIFDFCCYVVRAGHTVCCNEGCPSNSDNRSGFVFFIDDLDRIDPNLALEIIEMLASVFSFKKCTFILAVDKRSLMRAVKSKLVKRMIVSSDNNSDSDNNNDDDKNTKSINEQYERYLDRFVHVSISVPKVLYDIQPLLRESLVKISFFTPEELNDDLLRLLDKVISFSVGRNPRSIKQLVNSLSLMVSFEVHTWKYDEDEKPWQIKGLTKEILFIMQCIKIKYPKAFEALLTRPYFKGWDIEYATKCFNANDPNISQSLACQCNASKDWEYALFHICKFNEKSQSKFYGIRQIFEAIDDVFKRYLLNCNIKQSEQEFYNKVISDISFYFYRVSNMESKVGYYQEHIVKTTEEYRRKR